jgi:hypothetical protein
VAKYFWSEPGVARIDDDGTAMMFTGTESWPVVAREIYRDMRAREIGEFQFHKAVRDLKVATAKLEKLISRPWTEWDDLKDNGLD